MGLSERRETNVTNTNLSGELSSGLVEAISRLAVGAAATGLAPLLGTPPSLVPPT